MGVDMQRARYDPAAKLRAIEAPEPDLLEALEDRDRCLYNLVSMATRYRTILSDEIQHLRVGKDEDTVQASLGRWQAILRDIKKLAGDL
jgi:hypothetical protein